VRSEVRRVIVPSRRRRLHVLGASTDRRRRRNISRCQMVHGRVHRGGGGPSSIRVRTEPKTICKAPLSFLPETDRGRFSAHTAKGTESRELPFISCL
jgi:hypothetical protein